MKKQYDIHINYDWCKRCGICYNFCPTGALSKDTLLKPIVADRNKCIGCLMCENLCPDFAIIVKQLEAVHGGAENV